MSRPIARFAVLLIALAVSATSALAQAPTKDASSANAGNTYTGSITVYGGSLDAVTFDDTANGSLTLSGNISGQGTVYQNWSAGNSLGYMSNSYSLVGVGYFQSFAAKASAARAPMPSLESRLAGKVYYIVTQGAAQGDNVRCCDCSEPVTVLDAVSAIQGIPTVSSGKMWIERPTPNKPGHKTVLSIDWEAIAHRGIDSTNYKIEPSDRLVLDEDPLVARGNRINQKFNQIARLTGAASLTTSTFSHPKSAPANNAMVKGLVRQGFFTDDPEMKKFVMEAIRLKEESPQEK